MGKRTNKPYYNRTNTCDRCREHGKETKLIPGNILREYNKEGDWTGKWDCKPCYERYDPNSHNNIKKSLAGHRTGYQNLESEQAKGKRSQELVCKLYEWEDLNKKYDNYATPIDCHDPKTGLYHQVQGRYYNSIERCWTFTNFENERFKKYENMVCFCFSKDGKIVERIYKFPKEEIDSVIGVTIYKDPTDSHSNPKISWYEKYRIKDEYELKRANGVWQQILKENV